MNPLLLLMVGLPLVALAFSGGRPKPEWDTEDYMSLYRLEDPDRYTPGEPQFDLGRQNLTYRAQEVIGRAEDAVSEVTGQDASGRLEQMLFIRHSEGDWGDLEEKEPDWAARQDAESEAGTWPILGFRGVHNIAGNEVWVQTDALEDGNATTIYLRGEN